MKTNPEERADWRKYYSRFGPEHSFILRLLDDLDDHLKHKFTQGEEEQRRESRCDDIT